jgi:hypothetical protein
VLLPFLKALLIVYAASFIVVIVTTTENYGLPYWTVHPQDDLKTRGTYFSGERCLVGYLDEEGEGLRLEDY